MRDVIVIGKGPAGISAALYIKRAGLDVLVIGKDYGALSTADKIDNYYGFGHTISGRELVENGIKQAKRLGIEILTQEVISITKNERFEVKTLENAYEANLLLLATGKKRTGMKIPGFERFKGKGISFCAVCDGFFFRGKKLALIGSGDYAAAELEELKRFTEDITVFTNQMPITTDKFGSDVNIVTDKILSIDGQDRVEKITTEKGEYPVDGIFVAIGTASAADFATKIGVMTDKDRIIVDSNYMTNLEGLYAAGDAIGGLSQIAKAVADGALAAVDIIKKAKILKKGK